MSKYLINKMTAKFIVASAIMLTIIFSASEAKPKVKNTPTPATRTSPVGIVIDADISFEEAIKGTKAKSDLIQQLVLINVQYYSLDNRLHQGQLIVNKAVESDVKKMFQIIKDTKFPINHVIPIVKYDWSDDASMEDNNTSSFNFRTIAGTDRISLHGYGRAVDINPFFNPVVYNDGKIIPKGAHYDTTKPGRFTKDCKIVKEFKKLGWRWGGEFNSYKDNHHFDKEK
jgi:peptidoglycan LD-endopeptidase CwlK